MTRRVEDICIMENDYEVMISNLVDDWKRKYNSNKYHSYLSSVVTEGWHKIIPYCYGSLQLFAQRANLNPTLRWTTLAGRERERLPRWHQDNPWRGDGVRLSCKSRVVELYDKTSRLTSLTHVVRGGGGSLDRGPEGSRAPPSSIPIDTQLSTTSVTPTVVVSTTQIHVCILDTVGVGQLTWCSLIF